LILQFFTVADIVNWLLTGCSEDLVKNFIQLTGQPVLLTPDSASELIFTISTRRKFTWTCLSFSTWDRLSMLLTVKSDLHE
jgi:hypothetical protein